MVEIDRHLSKLEHDIPSRPIRALEVISKKFSISLPMSEPPPRFQDKNALNWHITKKIYKWYEEHYGDRLKEDWSIGKMVILVENDIWVLKFPCLFGSGQFIVSRTIESDGKSFQSKPVIYNVLDAVQGLEKRRIGNLPDYELAHIYEKFQLGYQAFNILIASSSIELIGSAIADIEASVNHLGSNRSDYGLSKWSSLQAAEKMLKATLSMIGKKYSHTHNLSNLVEEITSNGISGNWELLIKAIQCSPGIRYGKENCGRDDAIRAHHASLALIIMLKAGGAKFDTQIDLTVAC